MTYAELEQRSHQLSSHFKKGELVGILGQRNFAVYEGIVAITFAGAIYVPINSKFPIHKKIEIVKEAGIKKIICSQSDYLANQDFLTSSCIKLIIIPDAVDLRDSKVTGYNLNSEKSYSKIDGTDLIYVMFTSGSTGKPKGVMVTHQNVLALLDNLDHFYPALEPGYRCSQTFDLSFDPSVCDIFYTWKNGGVLCILNEKELFCPSEYIKREKINFWHSVPLLAEYMGKLGKLHPNEFPDLIYSVFTGEPVKKAVVDKWRIAAPNSSIENRYGPTETTVDVLRYQYTEKDFKREFTNGILPIGSKYQSLDFKIVTPNFKDVPNGEKGELLIAGPQVTMGYLKDQEKTQKSFITIGSEETTWYRTGDEAFVNQDGQVECLGRIDKQIKLAGKRIELGEIEYFILKTSLLRDLIVVPLRNSENLVTGIMGFTTDETSPEKLQKIRERSRYDLDPSFFPKVIKKIDEFPILTSGKIDRNELERIANS